MENGKQKQKTSKCDRFATAKLYYKNCAQRFSHLVLPYSCCKLYILADITSIDLNNNFIALLQTNTPPGVLIKGDNASKRRKL